MKLLKIDNEIQKTDIKKITMHVTILKILLLYTDIKIMMKYKMGKLIHCKSWC